MNIPILIIAAGNSSRLGRPKQLEIRSDNNLSLLQHVIQEANIANHGQVIVVLGSEIELIQKQILSNDCIVLDNTDWKLGMSTSIVKGIRFIENQKVDGVIIVLSDQVHIDHSYFNDIVNSINNNEALIVFSKYEESSGPPIYFDKKFFKELSLLQGDVGANSVLQKHIDLATSIDFALGHIDIDYESDIQRLKDL